MYYFCKKKRVGRKKKLPVIEKVTISGLAAEGKAMAKIDNKVLFVKYGVPGDVVDVQLTRKRKKYMEGKIVRVHQYSRDRVEPFCKHYGTCGGCAWQSIPYSMQLETKEKQVFETLTRLGGFEIEEKLPVIPSDGITRYRNKLEFTFSNKRWLSTEEIASGKEIDSNRALGFHVPGLFDKIVDIDECHLQDEPSNSIRQFVRDYTGMEDYQYFNIKNPGGLLRNLIIRTTLLGETMVILSFFREDKEKRDRILHAISQRFPEITSLFYVINPKGNDTILDLNVHLFKGREYILEQLEDLKFKIGPKSFFQTNSAQALKLYQLVREFANPDGHGIVYDLYTGTGTIANFLASGAKKVIGIENVPEAIEDARENARLNGIGNTSFHAADMKDILTVEFIEKEGRPDVIVLDPPRAGIHPDVAKTIKEAAPARIVYVSCNPGTQARDIGMISDDYKVKKVQPVDMFPHTHHIESVALLEKK